MSARHFHKRKTGRKVIIGFKNFCRRDRREQIRRAHRPGGHNPLQTCKIPSVRGKEGLDSSLRMGSPAVCPEKVSELLAAWRKGDDDAFTRLIPLVYEDLRRLAHRHMASQRPDHTLQTTALVNEAFLRLAGQTSPTGRTAFILSQSRPV